MALGEPRYPSRMTTRRARACDPQCRRLGDHELRGLADASELFVGCSFETVTLMCTIVDIGDPRFRLFLVNVLAPRVSGRLNLEIVR